jgi:hypothetical protein
MTTVTCPSCKNPLQPVKQSPNSLLNAEQFDAIKVGDYYCETCPSNGRGKTNYCYYWTHELTK